MKKYALPLLLALFVFCHTASASSSSSTNNNTKTQPENNSTNNTAKKYNFTLFSFFNQAEKPKIDTSIIRNNRSINSRPLGKE